MLLDRCMLDNTLERDPYSIHNIWQILQEMAGNFFYSVLDLHSCFSKYNYKKRLAFITENSQYIMNRLPFSTKLSSNIFARLMNLVLGRLKDKYNIQYFIDDVLIGANSIQEIQ